MNHQKAVFFDRDGIVNKRLVGEYVTKKEEFEFEQDIFELLSFVKQSGYLAIIITNQQGIGKKIMSEEDLHDIHDFMQQILVQKIGCQFDDIYYCGELSDSASSRRKPSPRMILEAAEKYNIDLSNSLMIGDMPTDAEAGSRAGCQTLLISEEKTSEYATFHVKNLRMGLEMVKKVLKKQ